MKPTAGNGSGNINIQATDHGGWISVYPSSEAAADDFPGNLALVLAKSLNSWFEEHPRVRLQFALPVTRNGRTYEIYAWYEKQQQTTTATGSLELADHQLADADMADFHESLKRLGASLESRTEKWTSPSGMVYHRLTQCRVLTGKDQLPQIEALCAAHGFCLKRQPS
ncbi:MAG: hypothetical protein ACREHD_23505 [Pirellulales bacterium]